MEATQIKCPICGGRSLTSPGNIESIVLHYLEKEKSILDITQIIETKSYICNNCDYVMLFKK